jgi:hypothetical protein
LTQRHAFPRRQRLLAWRAIIAPPKSRTQKTTPQARERRKSVAK